MSDLVAEFQEQLKANIARAIGAAFARVDADEARAQRLKAEAGAAEAEAEVPGAERGQAAAQSGHAVADAVADTIAAIDGGGVRPRRARRAPAPEPPLDPARRVILGAIGLGNVFKG